MIVVDGRTDREKLIELLSSPEETHLEFKSELDLSSLEHELNFVKDAVSMANRPPGGYIVIGVNDNGKPQLPVGSITDRAEFDGARLGDKIRKYVDSEVHVVCEFHEMNDHELALIFLPHHRNGLPVPMSKQGQYSQNGRRPKVVFRKGDLFVREGAQNNPLRYAHWSDILKSHDQRIREEIRKEIDPLISALTSALHESDGPSAAAVPLDMELSDEAFSKAITYYLETGKFARLNQFLGTAIQLVNSPEQQDDALRKIAILAVHAMYFECEDIATRAIDEMFESYITLQNSEVETRLKFVIQAYILGSFAVRTKKWTIVHNLVLREFQPNFGGYTFSSWIRQGQLEASRAQILGKGLDGRLISHARDVIQASPMLRPDLSDEIMSETSEPVDSDPLLDSLCQFDILFCLIIFGEGQHNGGGFPSSIAFHPKRANPAFEKVVTDAQARSAMFPTANDKKLAESIIEVFNLAKNATWLADNPWYSLPPKAQGFVDKLDQQST